MRDTQAPSGYSFSLFGVLRPLQATASSGLSDWDNVDTIRVMALIAILFVFDVFCSQRADYTLKHHVLALLFMLLCSAAFGACVWRQRGKEDGIAWATGYALEWALSIDNLFVFHLVFKAFSVPNDQAVKALSFGIYGAICLRFVFILCLTKLLTLHNTVDIVIGLFLFASGLLTLQEDQDHSNVQDLRTVRFFKWLFGGRLQ